jgi:hypothetical protein
MNKIRLILNIINRYLLNPLVYLIVTILLLLSIRLVFIINMNPNSIIILIAVCGIIGDWIMSNVDISDIDNNMQETMHEWHEDYKNDAKHERIANYKKIYELQKKEHDRLLLEAQAKEHDRLLKEKADAAAAAVPSSSAPTYTYTSLKDIVSTSGMEDSFGKLAMILLNRLKDIEERDIPLDSDESISLINALFPQIDPSNNKYDDLKIHSKSDNYKTMQDLDKCAKDTNNPILQRFMALYKARCYVYTQIKYNEPVDENRMLNIVKEIMEEYKKTT